MAMSTLEMRQLCEGLLEQVPDSALDETLGTLQQIITFWGERDALPPLASLPTKQIRVRLSPPSIRPEFPIAPDEIE